MRATRLLHVKLVFFHIVLLITKRHTVTVTPQLAWGQCFSFSRDFPGILIVLISKTSGMGKWYSWDFDCLIFREPF